MQKNEDVKKNAKKKHEKLQFIWVTQLIRDTHTHTHHSDLSFLSFAHTHK